MRALLEFVGRKDGYDKDVFRTMLRSAIALEEERYDELTRQEIGTLRAIVDSGRTPRPGPLAKQPLSSETALMMAALEDAVATCHSESPGLGRDAAAAAEHLSTVASLIPALVRTVVPWLDPKSLRPSQVDDPRSRWLKQGRDRTIDRTVRIVEAGLGSSMSCEAQGAWKSAVQSDLEGLVRSLSSVPEDAGALANRKERLSRGLATLAKDLAEHAREVVPPAIETIAEARTRVAQTLGVSPLGRGLWAAPMFGVLRDFLLDDEHAKSHPGHYAEAALLLNGIKTRVAGDARVRTMACARLAARLLKVELSEEALQGLAVGLQTTHEKLTNAGLEERDKARAILWAFDGLVATARLLASGQTGDSNDRDTACREFVLAATRQAGVELSPDDVQNVASQVELHSIGLPERLGGGDKVRAAGHCVLYEKLVRHLGGSSLASS